MIKTYKFKLYSSKRNRKLHRQIDAAGLTYNHCIALHKRYYRLFHKYLNKYKLQKHLAKLKKSPKFSYLTEYGSQAVQNVTERIGFGYKKFFEKQNKKPPKFRKLHKCKSITLKQAGWKLDEANHAIVINGQKYRYHKSRDIDGVVKTVTVKRDMVGDIYIFLACNVEQNKVIPRLGESIGFDFCLKKRFLVAPTEENDIDMPMFFKRNRRKLRNAQKRLSRKLEANVDHYAKGRRGGRVPVWRRPLKQCSNIQRGFKEVAHLHRKVANQREAYHWALAQELCGKYAVICLESLNMKWMQKGHGKKVGDYGFSNFVRILRYVASRTGTTVVQVDRLFASSQLCYECGYKNKIVKNVNVEEWNCPECGAHHNRDRNAAKNILREGLRVLVAS